MNKAFVKNDRTVHVSNRSQRAIDFVEERIFLELWNEKQKRSVGINNGYGLLDLVLNEQEVTYQPPGLVLTQRLALIDTWSARDAKVAASVIQWLGTKEGVMFLDEAESRISKAKKLESENYHRVHNLGLEKLP